MRTFMMTSGTAIYLGAITTILCYDSRVSLCLKWSLLFVRLCQYNQYNKSLCVATVVDSACILCLFVRRRSLWFFIQCRHVFKILAVIESLAYFSCPLCRASNDVIIAVFEQTLSDLYG